MIVGIHFSPVTHGYIANIKAYVIIVLHISQKGGFEGTRASLPTGNDAAQAHGLTVYFIVDHTPDAIISSLLSTKPILSVMGDGLLANCLHSCPHWDSAIASNSEFEAAAPKVLLLFCFVNGFVTGDLLTQHPIHLLHLLQQALIHGDLGRKSFFFAPLRRPSVEQCP